MMKEKVLLDDWCKGLDQLVGAAKQDDIRWKQKVGTLSVKVKEEGDYIDLDEKEEPSLVHP